MELEERVQVLEQEVRTLKFDIQKTLVEIRETLPARPAAAARWQKNAWVLALVNLLLAVVLFTNIYLYLPMPAPFSLSATLLGWLRALWLALAFIWLLLQLYPLALLLQQEDTEWQGIAWRNATAFLRVHPGFLVALTLAVLVIAIVNTALPALWLLVALSLLIAIGTIALRNILELMR